ncbi:amidase family protein [Pseudomonas sp. PCH446]
MGTDTFGSVICPAAKNGIVGMKPSVGLLSRTGIIPASRELDSAGPMTRTVRDAALLLNAMTASIRVTRLPRKCLRARITRKS